jgi:hypothetical protein
MTSNDPRVRAASLVETMASVAVVGWSDWPNRGGYRCTRTRGGDHGDAPAQSKIDELMRRTDGAGGVPAAT